MTVTMTKRCHHRGSTGTRFMRGTESLPTIAESGSRPKHAMLFDSGLEYKKHPSGLVISHSRDQAPLKKPGTFAITPNSRSKQKDSDDMLFPKHTPCFLSPRNATMVIAFVSIVYGILTVVTAAISLTTGQDKDLVPDEKTKLFRLIQYSTIGVGVIFVLFSGMLVFGVRSANRFLHLPWLFWAAIQIIAIFVGAILIFVSLTVTASMIFSLVFNMLVGAIFCYCFLVVHENYKHLVHVARPDAVRYEKDILNN